MVKQVYAQFSTLKMFRFSFKIFLQRLWERLSSAPCSDGRHQPKRCWKMAQL